MSDREILLRWLATAAARLGWSRRVRELSRLACVLVALWLLAEVLYTLGTPAPALSALAPLLILAALAAVVLFAWRLARRTTLAQAAGTADARAGLKDELKSAHWYAQHPARHALVELLLARAARTAQRLDARRLFPLGLPRSVFTALALVALTGSLAWFSPRIALPGTQEPMSARAPAASGKAGDALREKEVERIAAELASPPVAPRDDGGALWSQLEQMTRELPAGAEKETIGRAVAAHDTQLAVQLLQALERAQAAAAQQDPAARQEGERMPADVAQGILERLQQMLNEEGNAARDPATNASAEPVARVTQQVRAQMREEQRRLQGQPTQGEVALNPRLRAVSRNSTSMREVAYGEGEAAEAGAQTSVDGTATGTRTGRSRGGGSEGEHPQSSPTDDADTQLALGAQTVRLEAQLQKVRVERNDDPQEETEEAFYAATHRQASQVGYESVTARWRAQREAALSPSRTPLAYREGVKRYFLTQHGKEE